MKEKCWQCDGEINFPKLEGFTYQAIGGKRKIYLCIICRQLMVIEEYFEKIEKNDHSINF